MATAAPPKPEQTQALPETAPQPAPPPANLEATAPALAGPALQEPAVYWPDWYCLRFWLAGAGILVMLHLMDAISRLLRMF